MRRLITLCLLVVPLLAAAGEQAYEPLAASVQASLSKAVSDSVPRHSSFNTEAESSAWLAEMSRRMARFIPDTDQRTDFLKTVHYEATRAGLDPEFVLGLIQVESGFKKYAVSSASARGYMQVMPFWVKLIGAKDQNLFHMRTNLRYGCTILRHYVDIERGDLYRALGRYNGSLGQPQYPTIVVGAWRNGWMLNKPSRTVEASTAKHPG
jgi:soluble lytic murein transglycosylase-like protein